MRHPRMPRLAAALLRVALPGDWRDDILRDLEEAWGDRARRGGLRAVPWLVWQVATFTLRFLPARIAEVAGRSRLSSLDLRLAVRAVARAPGLTALSLVALVLGIGTTAGAFAFVRGAFFNEIPYPGGERIYVVDDYDRTRGHALPVGVEEFRRRAEALTSFEYLGAYRSRGVLVGATRRVTAQYVTPEILALTEVSPLLGRLPDEADAAPGAQPVVLLPHFLWVSETGGDPDVLGSAIRVDGVDRTVVGVMPEGFGFPRGHELWLPLDPTTTEAPVRIVGKLREGVEVEAARAEMAVVARPDPAALEAPDDRVSHLVTKMVRPVTDDAQLLWLAAPMTAFLLLLVVMATNVATLVLARNAARSGELAVRVALGASRARVVGQLVLEVALTVAVAATIGLALAQWALGEFASRVTGLPFWIDFSLDPLVVAFTVTVAGLATLVAGVAPALRATSGRVHESLKDATRGTSGLRFGRTTDLFVVIELALSVGFLAAAAGLGQSLLTLGVDRSDLPARETLVAQVVLPAPRAAPASGSDIDGGTAEEVREAHLTRATRVREALMERARAFPGVSIVAAGSRFPGDESERSRVEVEGGRPDAPRTTEVAAVGPEYFELLAVAPLRGRSFEPGEEDGDRAVVLVDETFVRNHLPPGPGLGRRLRLAPAGAEGEEDLRTSSWLEIVGVLPDLGLSVDGTGGGGTVYRPLGPSAAVWIGLRGEGDPHAWTPALLEAAREIDADARVAGVQSLHDLVMLPVRLFRTLGLGFLALGGVTLLLSAATLHALTACSVTRRTRELGIRRALGARSGRLAVATARRTAAQLGAGVVLGGGLTFGLLHVATWFPWRLGGWSPWALLVVAILLAGSVFAALLGPLARALSIRPADALRYE